MTAPDVLSRKYDELLNTVQNISFRLSRLEEQIVQNSSGWSGAQDNVTETRNFDADTVAVAELADVVGTLISDLVNTRVIS